MIRLTQMDGNEVYINPDLIETVEERPDTHIALTNGHRYIVLEPASVLIDRIIAYRARIMRQAGETSPRRYLKRNAPENYHPFCKLPKR
jgi:flagellar protein FlbD